MDEVRRGILTGIGATPLVLASNLVNAAQTGKAVPSMDQSTLDFWSTEVRKPTENLRAGVQYQAPITAPEFVYFDSQLKSFSLADTLPATNIPSKGDAKSYFEGASRQAINE